MRNLVNCLVKLSVVWFFFYVLFWYYLFFFFFFQAEDGIRDTSVTGVQTCALPISWGRRSASSLRRPARGRRSSSANLVDTPRGCREAAARAAVPHGHDLGHDRECGLLCREPAQVEPDRGGDASQLLVGQALLDEPLAALLLGSP